MWRNRIFKLQTPVGITCIFQTLGETYIYILWLPWYRQMCLSFEYMSRDRHRNLLDRQCVSSRWPLYWFRYLHELCIEIWFSFVSRQMGCATCIYLYWLLGKGMAYGGLPFPGTGYPIPDVSNIFLIWNIECMGYCFCTCPLPRDVSLNGLSFWKTDWMSYHGPLYHIYIMNSKLSALYMKTI